MKQLGLFILTLCALWGAPAGAGSSGIPAFSETVPQGFREYLTSALQELYSVQGDAGTAMHKEIFGGAVNGDVYRRWFSRVRRIEMVKDNCSYTARIDSKGKPGVIYISSCVNQKVGDESKVYWLSVLFHEARHLEADKGHWHHDVIIDSNGMPVGYDKSPYGAYGLEKVFAFNLAKYCANCSPEFKQRAQDVFEDDMNWRKLSPEAIRRLEADSK
ncbi:MAG: hypothetical protein HUU57_08385 [Bdellovibrio sp.]|nr:hypothetical protein [Bdellovibrio sp.]